MSTRTTGSTGTRTTGSTRRTVGTGSTAGRLAGLVLSAVVVGAGTSAGPAAASTGTDRPATAGDTYVASLVARSQAAQPYSQAADYVDTLVYWHHHPKWGFEK